MALSKKMLIIGSSVGLILLIVVTLSVVMSKSSPTQRPTTRAPTTKVPQAPTTKAPTTLASTLNSIIPNSLVKNQYLKTIYTGESSSNKAIPSSEQFLMSPNGIYRLYLQSDGNLVIYKRVTNLPVPNAYSPVWSSKSSVSVSRRSLLTNGTFSLKLVLENNGDLVLYYYYNNLPNTLVPVYSTKTGGKGGNKLVLQDDGNLVIYRNLNNTSPVWSSSSGML